MAATEPLIVEVLRGGLVESRHRVNAVASAADGRLVRVWGEPERLVFPR